MSDEHLDGDVLIVGGGPGGSTAAYLLSRAGLKVCLLDQAHFPRPKLCGGAITGKTTQLLGRIYGETTSALLSRGILDTQADHYELRWRDRSLILDPSPAPFYFLDRRIYDTFLLQCAREAGVEVIEGSRVVAADPVRCTATTTEGRTLRGRFLIGADGINSVVRRAFVERGLIRQAEWERFLCATIQVSVPRAALDPAPDHPILFQGVMPWGYGWLFPNRERLIVGLGGLMRHNRGRYRDEFCNFLDLLGIDQALAPHLTGHLLQCGGYLRRPALGRCLLVGDAAGLADPMTGEGIFQAQHSGELAAQAIIESIGPGVEAAVGYTSRLERHLFPEFALMKRMSWWAYTVIGLLGPWWIRFAFRRIQKRYEAVLHDYRNAPLSTDG